MPFFIVSPKFITLVEWLNAVITWVTGGFKHWDPKPISISAISLAIFVISKAPLGESTRRHETIHFWQQVEMLFVAMWLAYAGYYIAGRARGEDHMTAYMNIPFEREAYANDDDPEYLERRKFWAWLQYRN